MTWTLTNLKSHLSQSTWESFFDITFPRGMLLGAFLVTLLYPLCFSLLNKFNSRYQCFDREKKIAVLIHVIEMVVLGILFIPMSVLIFIINFYKFGPDELVSFKDIFGILLVLFSTIIVMYMLELVARLGETRPIMFIHHFIAISNGILLVFFPNTANVKACSLLVYFIVFEVFLFAGLVMYRLKPDSKYTSPLIMFGMIFFGVSRFVQVGWILLSLVYAWKHISLVFALLQIVLSALLTTIQLYGVYIHWMVFRKSKGDVLFGMDTSSDSLFRTSKDDFSSTIMLGAFTTTDCNDSHLNHSMNLYEEYLKVSCGGLSDEILSGIKAKYTDFESIK